MTRNLIRMEPVAAVTPLRARRKKDNSLYTRRPNIEQMLADLSNVPIDEIARRAAILDQQDPEFLPPEVLMHFLRRSKSDGDTEPYRLLFASLRQRLLQRLPVREWRNSGQPVSEDRKQADVRQQVLDRVIELLCADRGEYDVRLDYFEINFNGAVARARKTAWRDSCETEKSEKTQSLNVEMSAGEDNDVDEALRSLRGVSENSSDAAYRLEVFSEINSLPDEEREVILMLIEGFKIKEIAEAVGCTEKTVSARRNRARAKLSEEMNLEEKS